MIFNLTARKLFSIMLFICIILSLLTINAKASSLNSYEELLNELLSDEAIEDSSDLSHYNDVLNDLESKIDSIKKEKEQLKKDSIELEEKIKKKEYKSKYIVNKNNLKLKDLGVFHSTAYDLGYSSTGKPFGAPGYGLTASGFDLSGMSRTEAMTVAVDRRLIPLGTKLYIEFPEPYSHFNGIYTARDVGGAIKQKKIDLFMGDFKQNASHSETRKYGRRNVRVYKVL